MPSRVRRQPAWVGALAALLVVVAGLFSAVGAFTLAEEQDPLCAACHRPQEVLYVSRAEASRSGSEAVDLAAAHAARGMACVACHRGNQSPRDRAATMYLGIRNAVAYLSGRPAGLSALARELEEASCWRCHGDVVEVPGFEKHFHNLLLEYAGLPQVAGRPENQLLCVDCHVSHAEAVGVPWFVVEGQVLPQCEKCHTVWGRGPQRMLP